MTLSASSTLAQVQAAYDNNAAYREANSLSMAAAFITACRILIRRTPLLAGHGNRQLQIFVQGLQKELQDATRWFATSGGSNVAVPTFSPDVDFRG